MARRFTVNRPWNRPLKPRPGSPKSAGSPANRSLDWPSGHSVGPDSRILRSDPRPVSRLSRLYPAGLVGCPSGQAAWFRAFGRVDFEAQQPAKR